MHCKVELRIVEWDRPDGLFDGLLLDWLEIRPWHLGFRAAAAKSNKNQRLGKDAESHMM